MGTDFIIQVKCTIFWPKIGWGQLKSTDRYFWEIPAHTNPNIPPNLYCAKTWQKKLKWKNWTLPQFFLALSKFFFDRNKKLDPFQLTFFGPLKFFVFWLPKKSTSVKIFSVSHMQDFSSPTELKSSCSLLKIWSPIFFHKILLKLFTSYKIVMGITRLWFSDLRNWRTNIKEKLKKNKESKTKLKRTKNKT